MANGTPPAATVLPFTTGSPGMDSLVRSGLIAGAAALTAVIVTWLNAHGFKDPNLNLMISGAILTTMMAGAGAAWGFYQQKIAKAFIVDHVVAAAASGQVSPAIIASANPTQLATIIESGTAKTPEAQVAMTAALNKSQTGL